MTFSEEITDLGLTRMKLADLLGVLPSAVTIWGERPPKYAVAYLKLFREKKEVMDEIEEMLEQFESTNSQAD